MVGERDRRHDQVNAAFRLCPSLDNAVVVGYREQFRLGFNAADTDSSRQHVRHRKFVQAVFLDDFAHGCRHFLVLLPLRLQGTQNLALGFAVDDVDFALVRLQERRMR